MLDRRLEAFVVIFKDRVLGGVVVIVTVFLIGLILLPFNFSTRELWCSFSRSSAMLSPTQAGSFRLLDP